METAIGLIVIIVIVALGIAAYRNDPDYYNSAYADKQSEKKVQREFARNKRDSYINQNKNLGIPMCPKCKSTSVTYIQKKGLSGGIIAPVGKVGLMVGASTNPKHGYCKCLNCGKTWKK